MTRRLGGWTSAHCIRSKSCLPVEGEGDAACRVAKQPGSDLHSSRLQAVNASTTKGGSSRSVPRSASSSQRILKMATEVPSTRIPFFTVPLGSNSRLVHDTSFSSA